ncbi:MAG: TonB-dependent receptor [Cyclobacteriaceae bacterium]|nr:TonB-dependent receptor [Cyclobacteriaceae bacterium]
MRKFLLFLAFAFLAVPAIFAQVTTASLTGSAKDDAGAGIPGASVVATHEPSGTTYGSVTLSDGKFVIPNMRVGGPYKITISFVGYKTQTYEGIYLKLGEPYVLNHLMKEEGTQLDEIVVTGVEDAIMNRNRNGALTNIDSKQILSMPSITRSMNDMIRMTPQATSTNTGAIGGGNYRQNYITVDGSDFNNTFGIGGNLPANGSPISLDALEEISINITPYDVKQSSFTGSAINAVTRSGTNSFSGSAYTFWRNENQQGNKVGDNAELTRQPLQINTYGFRLGGPIIKNKLFFFVNAETGKEVRPGQLNVAATPSAPFGSSPNVSRPLASELDFISTYLRENYGYATGPYQGYDLESSNQRFVARIDWNINNNHRFNIRYSQVESKNPSFVSTSRSPMTNYATGAGRTNNNALWYKNSNYYQEANFYSLAAELNSLFGGKFANTLRFSFTNQNDPRSSDSGVFPFVDILEGGTPFTSFGYEPFTFGNLREVKSYSLVDYVTWTSGMHNFTAGIQADMQTTKNGFQRFATSYYTFNSWDDFVNLENPRDFAITYSLLPGYEQAFPSFKFAQYSAYFQDEMAINDKFRLTAGVRFDLPTYIDVKEIQTHPLVADLTFEDGQTVDTGVLPKNRVMVSPRIGFNWDVKGDRSLQVRGGTGIFTGRVPTVWIVAQSGDAGLLQITQTWQGAANLPFSSMPFDPDPNAYRPTTQPTPGQVIPGSVSTTDPNFKFPQTWKTSLAVDSKLPYGMIGSLETILNRDLNVAFGKNVNLAAPTALNATGYPDNRGIYPLANRDKFINPLTNAGQAVPNGDATGTGAFNPIVLSNGSKGYYFSVSAKLEKQFSSGFSAMLAYVHSNAKNLYDGTGDQLINTWSGTPIVGAANNPPLSFANYVVPNRVIASLSYRKEYLKRFATSVSLFYEGSIQGRFSYTYSSDFNRDGQTNDLIYIPKDASEITFTDFNYGTVANPNVVTAQQQSDIFFAYIEQDEYLKKNKGSYAERNGAKLPWRNQIDFRFAQDIFVSTGKYRNTLQFTLDIFNFGNFLNKNWGIFQQVNASSLLVPTNLNSVTPGGTTKPTFRLQTDRGLPVSETFRDNNSITSTYYMQFGLRYIFN